MKERQPNNITFLTNNLSWAMSTRFFELLIGLLSGILIARGLPKEEYGLYAYTVAFFSVFFIINTFGLQPLLTRELSKTNRNRSLFLGSAAVLQTIILSVSIPLTLFSYWITNESSLFKYGGTILALSALFVFDRFFYALLISDLKNKKAGTIMASSKLLFFLIRLLVFIYHPTLLLFLWTLFAESAIRLLFFLFVYFRSYHSTIGKWRYDMRIAKRICYNATPLLAIGIMNTLFQRIDLIMLGKLTTKSICGQYSIATIFLAVITFVPIIVSQTFFPVLVKSNKTSQELFNKQIRLLFNSNLLYSIFISIIGFFSLPYLLRFIYGNEYILATTLSQWVVWQVPFHCMAITSDKWIIAKNLQKIGLFRHAIGLVANILLNFLLIPRIGVKGAAISSIVAFFFSGYMAHLFIPTLRPLWRLQNLSFGFKPTVELIKVLIHSIQKQTTQQQKSTNPILKNKRIKILEND